MSSVSSNIQKMEVEEGAPLPEPSKRERRWVRVARRRLPALRWAARYTRLEAAADLVAGVTLGLMLVPQSIAYAALADLPVHYGLYSSFVGTMLYVLLGTVKEVSIGPTSLMALLTLQTCHGQPIEMVVMLTFLSGCVVLVMGLLQLGGLVELISPSVTSGFTSAMAVVITASQLKGLLGLSFMAETLPEVVQEVATHWRSVRLPDCLLGLVCCSVLLALRKLKDVKVSPKRAGLQKTLWLLSIGRNALVVCAASVFAYCTTTDVKHPLVKLSGLVEPGLPPVTVPSFSMVVDNSTLGFVDIVQRLSPGVAMMPVIMVVANISIAKVFTQGGLVDATQEMITLGLCNIAGSFVHAMPTCGAFTRSAVSQASGVRTPAAGLYSGIITLIALLFMTEYFYFIPKACLSSVLICAVIFMIDVSIVSKLWRESRTELFVLALTFVTGVARTMELAVLVGVLASLALLLRELMSASVGLHTVKWGTGCAVRAAPSLALVYVNAERVAQRALAAAARAPSAPLLLDCGRLALLDYSAGRVLERMAKTLEENSQKLIPYNASPALARQLARLGGLEARALRAASAADALLAAGEHGARGGEQAALLAAGEHGARGGEQAALLAAGEHGARGGEQAALLAAGEHGARGGEQAALLANDSA